VSVPDDAADAFCPVGLFAKIKMVEKTGTLKIESGKPLSFAVDAEMRADMAPLPDVIARTFKSYRNALKDLLNGRYADARDAAPWHMREPCDIFILRCSDGIIVRYDAAASEAPMMRIGRMTEADTLEKWVPPLSDYVLYCPVDLATFQPPTQGPRMTLAVHDQNGIVQQEGVPGSCGSSKSYPG
jgi:hypothetical protein